MTSEWNLKPDIRRVEYFLDVSKNRRQGNNQMLDNTENLMEIILEKENLNRAYQQVKRNGGAPGKDGMQVSELLEYLKQKGEALTEKLYTGNYRPKPVRRVNIPKPDGGERHLGIPTVIDRMIQQAVTQVLTPIYEKKFSEHSYGFRPGRSCHQAIQKAKEYIRAGNDYVVDIDLEKFFDRVNHDKLMSLIAKDIKDKRVLRLLRKYLKSGVLVEGLYEGTEEGTPQGGPISPLLSNIMLHELDIELETRGHLFCRYADDCNIYVRSKKAGERVMEGIRHFIEKRLKLKVNKQKSAVGLAYERKFLGFGFYKGKDGEVKIHVHKKSVSKLKVKIRKITSRSGGKSIQAMIKEIIPIMRGWWNYYRIDEFRTTMSEIDGWIRRRLRMCVWKQWKRIRTRIRELIILGMRRGDAIRSANTRKGYWRIAGSPILTCTLTNRYFENLGLKSLCSLPARK